MKYAYILALSAIIVLAHEPMLYCVRRQTAEEKRGCEACRAYQHRTAEAAGGLGKAQHQTEEEKKGCQLCERYTQMVAREAL